MSEQQYMPGQVVVMPVPQRNGLGVFGFLTSLVGLIVPTGIISFLGFVLSLAAIGRSPRGFAALGVVLGLLGSVFWLIVSLLAAAAALLGVAFIAVGFAVTQPEVLEVTSDMVNVSMAAREYEREHEQRPAELAVLPLNAAMTLDPWGRSYRLVADEASSDTNVVSSGPDGLFDTDDDIRSNQLERVWENAFATFEERMEAFGKRMERASDRNGETCCLGVRIPTGDYAASYECEALEALRREGSAEPSAPSRTGP